MNLDFLDNTSYYMDLLFNQLQKTGTGTAVRNGSSNGSSNNNSGGFRNMLSTKEIKAMMKEGPKAVSRKPVVRNTESDFLNYAFMGRNFGQGV